MKRIQEILRRYKENIQRLTEENESLKCSNKSLTLKIKKYENMQIFHEEQKYKKLVKYYKDKLYSVSKVIEAMRKEVKESRNLEERTSLHLKMESDQISNFSEETQRMHVSIKEKYESLNEQYTMIRKFTTNRAIRKQSAKVLTIYLY